MSHSGDAAVPSGALTDADRERLRDTFDSAAEIYHRARPDYPDALVEDVIGVAGLKPGARLLELGAGTGKATFALARRGFSITALEPGPQLAAAARRNLADLDVDVVESRLEEFEEAEPFDLVFAATAWHWIDPATKYGKAWHHLRRGGHLAFWSATHVFPDGGDPLFREIQQVYDEIGEGLDAGSGWPRPGELPDQRGEIEGSGLFEVVHVAHFDWERTYDAEGYIELLNTFSGHISMQDWQRERLYGAIRDRVAARPDGRLRRHWGAVLHVARALDAPSR